MIIPKNFEELQEYIWDEKQISMENAINKLPDSNEFQRGAYYGELYAYQNILDVLRNVLKYGDQD